MNRWETKSRFCLGQILATPGALEALEQSGDALPVLLRRHQRGDWGETCSEDARTNEDALQEGGRIFSTYVLRDGTRLWIITEADRAATTALLPDEY